MSNWTHVAGTFRIDHFHFAEKEPDFDQIFGKECLFDSPSEVWRDASENPEKYLPMGSEGSLKKSVWENPDKSCTAAYTVTVFGDLRDHDSTTEIIKWFDETCRKLWIRQAVITVENEENGCETKTFVQTDDE